MGQKKSWATEIVGRVENELGYQFTESETDDVLQYTLRKCQVNGKGESYAPLLFETELRDYLMRETVNAVGYANYQERARRLQCAVSV